MFDDRLFEEPKRARRLRDLKRVRESSYRVARLNRYMACNFPDTKADPSSKSYRTRDGYKRPALVAVTWEEADRERRSYATYHSQNRAKCSCSGCGNPRTHWGTLTRQEVRARVDAALQSEDQDV